MTVAVLIVSLCLRVRLLAVDAAARPQRAIQFLRGLFPSDDMGNEARSLKADRAWRLTGRSSLMAFPLWNSRSMRTTM
jgi:hypothetical protein